MSLPNKTVSIDHQKREVFLQNPSAANLAGLLDATILKNTATKQEYAQLEAEYQKHKFASVCVPLSCTMLFTESVKTCTVLNFPLGYESFTQNHSLLLALNDISIQELDYVHNIRAIKEQNWKLIETDALALVALCSTKNWLLKIIFETALLTPSEIVLASKIYANCGVPYLKTSTGFSNRGASFEDIDCFKQGIGEAGVPSHHMGIKASGGIRSYDQALAFIQQGVTRLGVSNAVGLLL
jgi:deoxyribose-phosphate aldolase